MKYAGLLALILLALAVGYWFVQESRTPLTLAPGHAGTETAQPRPKVEQVLEPLQEARETATHPIPSASTETEKGQEPTTHDGPTATDPTQLTLDALADLDGAQLREAEEEIREALNQVQWAEVERYVAAGWAEEIAPQPDGSFQHQSRREYIDKEDVQEVFTSLGSEHPVYSGRAFAVVLRRDTSPEYFRLRDLHGAIQKERKARNGDH